MFSRLCMIKQLWFLDDDKCESCPEILEELETIDDDTDKHGIQFVKSNDAKLAAEIGVFSFPALVYYETGVPIMYDGKYRKFLILFFIIELTLSIILVFHGRGTRSSYLMLRVLPLLSHSSLLWNKSSLTKKLKILIK